MKSRLVEYVGRYIADHLEDPELGLSQLSRVFFVSPAYLSRIFRERNGVTVSRQITVARIQRARRLLDDGCSVAETARRTGFSSPQYFSAVFRRYTGTAPLPLSQGRGASDYLTGRYKFLLIFSFPLVPGGAGGLQ